MSAPAAQSAAPLTAPATAVHGPAPVVQSPSAAPATSKSQTGAVTLIAGRQAAVRRCRHSATACEVEAAVGCSRESSAARCQAAAGHTDCEIALSRSMLYTDRRGDPGCCLCISSERAGARSRFGNACAGNGQATGKGKPPVTAKPHSNGQAACRRVALDDPKTPSKTSSRAYGESSPKKAARRRPPLRRLLHRLE